MKALRPISMLLIFAGVASCTFETAAEGESSEIGQAREAIVGGKLATENNFSAAVYSQVQDVNGNWIWFPRPCSGVVIRQLLGSTIVLTARHCLSIGVADARMPIVDSTQVMVSTALSPGLPNPNPPASAKQVGTLQSNPDIRSYGMKKNPSGPIDYNYYGDDLAVMGVPETLPLTPLPAGHFPTATLRMTPLNVGTSLYAEGYGQTIRDTNTGAGKLRYANGFVVQYLQEDGFAFNYPNSAGSASLWQGDSGGGDFVLEQIPTVNGTLFVWELAGIHSVRSQDGTVLTDAVPFGRDEFLLNTIGFFYATPVDSPGINLCINSTAPAVGSQLKANCAGDQVRTRWAFRRTTGMFEIYQEPPLFDPPPPKLCVEQQTNNLLKLHTCNPASTRQQWVVLEDHQIQNVATGQCITFLSTPGVGSCNGASNRKWIWHPSP